MRKIRKFTPDKDAPLLLAWQRGDMAAFETLVGKYLKRIFNFAFYLTGTVEGAAAAAEGAFAVAFTNINAFSSRFHFSNWLIALALKEARGLLDNRAALPSEEAPTSAGLHELLTRQIRQLPPELAEVLVLRDVRGYSLERLAEILQLRNDILVDRLFAAHEILAAQLNRNGSLPPAGGAETASPHPEIRRSFHAYRDSSLSAEDAATVKKHLKGCGSCREALAGLEWVVEHLKELPDIDPPHWLAAAIMQRVKLTPAKQATVVKAPPLRLLQVGAGLLLIAVTGLSAYLLLDGHGGSSPAVSGKEAARTAEVPSLQTPQQNRSAGFIPSITAPFSAPDRPAAPEAGLPVPTVPTVPLHQAAPPAAETFAAPSPAAGGPPAAATGKNDISGRHGRPEKLPELPPEWGESQLVQRPPQKKAAPVRSRSGELAVEMITADPVAAIGEVENAVTALGGKITGRAYSSGSDMLYTRIDIDRFFELMGRLEKVGVIQELPQPPEGAEGPVDLIIRWR